MPDASKWNEAATLYDFFCWASRGADQNSRWRIVTRDGKAHDGAVRYATSEFVVIGRKHSEADKELQSRLSRTVIPYASISTIEFLAEE